jgi:small subunit ribosomal protein S17
MPRRILKGVVVSDKCDKTIIVKVERNVLHPVYKKYIKRHARYAAHDPSNNFKVGDLVSIVESPPVSKTKKWVVQEQVS